MQTLVEAASHIAQEIERTRQHLTNLEQALEGLRPLITIDAATTALPFTATPQLQAVEDASLVNTEVSAGKVVKPKPVAKAKSKKQKSAEKTKSAKVKPAIAVPVKIKAEAQTKAVSKVGDSQKSASKAKGLPTDSAIVPSTGAELWLSCLARKKLSATELIDEAMKKLDLDTSSRVVINNRARAWLNASVKSGLVIAAGTRDGINLYKRATVKVSKGSEV
jgi:hypothetical protein